MLSPNFFGAKEVKASEPTLKKKKSEKYLYKTCQCLQCRDQQSRKERRTDRKSEALRYWYS